MEYFIFLELQKIQEKNKNKEEKKDEQKRINS